MEIKNKHIIPHNRFNRFSVRPNPVYKCDLVNTDAESDVGYRTQTLDELVEQEIEYYRFRKAKVENGC